MNLNHLRYFSEVVRQGSFRRASEELNISQPALSNSLKKLEYILDVPLLERSPQGVVPTAYGAALHQFALTAIHSVDRARTEIELLRGGSRGLIRVGASAGIIENIVPLIIADVAEQRPGFSFSVNYGYLNDLLDQLMDEQLDFLVASYWPGAKLTDHFEFKRFSDLNVSIYARRGHHLAKKKRVTLEDLSEADWILPESPGMTSIIRRLFGESHQSTVKQPITASHIPFIDSMMEQMDLLSLRADHIVAGHVRDGRFVKLNFPKINVDSSAGIIYKKDRTRTPAMRIFLETAERICSETLQ